MTNSKEKLIAFSIILLITFIYLFPAFLGKVDTPIDIRDSRMYPWSYYAVDSKIKNTTLWKSNIPDIHSINIPKNTSSEETFNINIEKSLLEKVSNIKPSAITYYFTFDFKAIFDKTSNLNFEVSLFNPLTGINLKLPGEVIKVKNPWYKTYIPLKELVKKSFPIKDLNSYNLKIKVMNNSKTNPSLFYLKDLKLLCDDYSQVIKTHNSQIEDLIQGFTPIREYFSESLKSGKLPFWNNYILTGSEFLAEPQIGFFHPLYFLCYLFFDHFTAHLLLTFICLLLCGIGPYLLLRYWGLDFWPSVFASIVYMFHPFNSVWFGFEHILINSATLPFLLLFYEKNLNETKLLNKYLLVTAFLLGLVFISGHLQAVYYTLIFFLLFSIFRFLEVLFLRKSNYLKHIFSILFAFSFAIMIGIIVLLPFITLAQNSHRVAISDTHIRDTSIPLSVFKSLVYPFYTKRFINEYVYFGLIPFLVSLLSIRNFFDRKVNQSSLLFFYIAIIISLLICTGSPVFFMIKNFIPGFNQLQHHRFLLIYSYAVPFLVAYGFQTFLDLISSVKQGIKTFLIIIIISYSAFDLMQHSSYFVTWSNRCDYKPIHKGGALEFLKERQKISKEPFRVCPIVNETLGKTALEVNVTAPNTLQPYKLEDPSGYSSFIPKDTYALFIYLKTKDPSKLYSKEILRLYPNLNIPYPISNYQSKIFDLLNVKYFILPPYIELLTNNVKKVFSGDCNIYENKDYLPRAFIVPGFKVIESPVETIINLDSSEFDPRNEVILMAYPHVIASREEVTKYNIDFVKYESNNITLKVKTNNAGFLVLGHNLTDNWKVKINNKEEKILQANLVQRAVHLSKAGEYKIEFYYFPKRFLIGLTITCTAIFILLASAFYIRLKVTA